MAGSEEPVDGLAEALLQRPGPAQQDVGHGQAEIDPLQVRQILRRLAAVGVATGLQPVEPARDPGFETVRLIQQAGALPGHRGGPSRLAVELPRLALVEQRYAGEQ